MIGGLDAVDWDSLTHAYGPAEDVPQLLRELRSHDAEVVDGAIHELFSNIFHQGTRYQASAYAVPFLLELAADPAVARRHQIVHLLAGLAIGYSGEYLATGFPVAELREEVAQVPPEVRSHWTGLANEWMRNAASDGGTAFPLSEHERRALETYHALVAYDAVREGVPVLADLAADADAELAGAAVYALAWFPERAEQIVPALAALAADDGNPVELASAAIVALGLVAPKEVDAFEELLAANLASEEPALRWSAAVAAAHLTGGALPAAALVELRAWASGCGDDYETTVWELTRSRIALELLDRVAEQMAGEVRTSLVVSELAKEPNSNWHNHFVDVLSYAFPDRDLDLDHVSSFAELAPAQRAVVTWLIGNPQVFGPFGPDMMLRMYGLPHTHDGLRDYAGVS